MTRDPASGVVLINVLVMLGLTAAVVYAMVSLADVSIARGQRFGEAGQALALLRAGEASAVVALRRDMTEAPGADYAAEPWGQIGQEAVAVAGGAFELDIADARGLYNLNGLARAGLLGAEVLGAIVEALELPPDTASRIADTIAEDGPLGSLADLGWRAGLPPEDIAALAPFVAALPGSGEVNVNSAPTELLAILLQNPVQARVLASIREHAGLLTPEDIDAAGLILPPGVGFQSDLFRLRVRARVGDTVQSEEGLLQRRSGPGGAPEVVVVRRRNGTAAVPPPPPS